MNFDDKISDIIIKNIKNRINTNLNRKKKLSPDKILC